MYLETKKCDYCGEEIKADLRRCPFCGSLLNRKKHQAEKTLKIDTEITKLENTWRESTSNEGVDVAKTETEKERTGMDESEIIEDTNISESGTEGEGVEKAGTDETNFIVVGEPYENLGEPYANAEEPYGNLEEPYENTGEPCGNVGELYGNLREQYDKEAFYKYEKYKNFTGSEVKEREYETSPLSNGLKVFLTVISTVIPGFGQLIGIITAIVFMNSEDSSDRRSFGISLLIASSIMFVFSFLFIFVIILVASSLNLQS